MHKILFTSLFCCAASGAFSQTADVTDTTDPDEIAAECGGTAGAGEILFESCAACHAITPDASGLLQGPHLHAVVGRTIGGVEGFDYSAGARLMAASEATWEREALHEYLANPAMSPGHPVVEDEQDRRDIMTYLRIATLPAPPAPGELEIPEAVFALKGDVAYGEYLGSECAGCHQTGSGTIPALHGMDGRGLVRAMHEYRARSRENEAMRMIAARLSDAEIAALAAYFETAQSG